MKPIAVFVDGWQFHQKCLPDDARKRTALMLRGEYRVWSVTHEDIEAALKQQAGTDLESPLSIVSTTAGKAIPIDRLPPIAGMEVRGNAIGLLLRLLGSTDGQMGDPLMALQSAGKHLLMRSVIRSQDVTVEQEARAKNVFSTLPPWLTEGVKPVHLQSPSNQGVQWVGKATVQYMSAALGEGPNMAGALVLDDRQSETDPKSLRIPWRHWLRLSNLLQATTGVALLTERILGKHQLHDLPSGSKPAGSTVSEHWNRILDESEFVDRLQSGMVFLANAGTPVPSEVGAEIEDQSGYRMAEVLWEPAKLVVLTGGQRDTADVWRAIGYRVVEALDEWWLEVQALLGEQTE